MIYMLIVHPKITISGPNQVVIGTNVSINCSITVEDDFTPDIHITTPLGETINASKIFFTALPNNTGNYTCSAIASKTVLKARHHLLVVNGEYLIPMYRICVWFILLCVYVNGSWKPTFWAQVNFLKRKFN